jgi:isoleucyl-tRNA synthetase
MLTIAKIGAPIAPFFMDKLYLDLNAVSQKENFESIHLADFPLFEESYIDKSLERKMEDAQTISSLVLSLRAKEKIKVRQPLQKIMIPVENEEQKASILAVANLIKHEVNIKEIELLEDASDILVKQIKPNFKTLGPKFGREMKSIANSIRNFSKEEISKIELDGKIPIEFDGKMINLELSDVEISSKDIEGWLVANEGAITVALDVTISEELRKEGVARELINRIQNARKDRGLEVTDKIKLTVLKFEDLEESINKNKEYIMSETLTEELVFVDQLIDGLDVEFDTIKSKILINKM